MKSADDRIGVELRGPGRQYFDDVVVDNMLDALLELTASLWVTQDRVYVLERVLENVMADSHARPDLARLIEAWQPSAADQERRRIAREELIASVYRGFARRSEAVPTQEGLKP